MTLRTTLRKVVPVIECFAPVILGISVLGPFVWLIGRQSERTAPVIRDVMAETICTDMKNVKIRTKNSRIITVPDGGITGTEEAPVRVTIGTLSIETGQAEITFDMPAATITGRPYHTLSARTRSVPLCR